MVTRVNGGPEQGVWFSAGVRFVNLTVTNGGVSFLSELSASPIDTDVDGVEDSVNGKLERVLEILSTRGTVIGLTVAGAAEIDVMVDYGQSVVQGDDNLGGGQFTDAELELELEAAIDAIADLSAASLTIEEGFAAAALGTPTP